MSDPISESILDVMIIEEYNIVHKDGTKDGPYSMGNMTLREATQFAEQEALGLTRRIELIHMGVTHGTGSGMLMHVLELWESTVREQGRKVRRGPSSLTLAKTEKQLEEMTRRYHDVLAQLEIQDHKRSLKKKG